MDESRPQNLFVGLKLYVESDFGGQKLSNPASSPENLGKTIPIKVLLNYLLCSCFCIDRFMGLQRARRRVAGPGTEARM